MTNLEETLTNVPISLTGLVYLTNETQTEIRVRNYDISSGIFNYDKYFLKHDCWAFVENIYQLVSPGTSVPIYLSRIVIGVSYDPVGCSFDISQVAEPSDLSVDELIKVLNGWLRGGGVPISVNGGTIINPLAGLNLIAGANITIAAAQNIATNLTDVTISAAGGGGGFSYTPVAVNTTPYTVAPITGWYMYLVDATAGAITMNFPTAVGNNAVYTVKKVDNSANTVILTPNGAETIDGLATQTIRFQNTSVDIYSDNANLYIM